MNIVYYGGYATKPFIFLAGPTQRVTGNRSWREDCVHNFEAKGFKGNLVLPEWVGGGDHQTNKKNIHWGKGDVSRWEDYHLTNSSLIIFWMPFTLIPGDMSSLPGLTTRLELGLWLATKPEKLIVGMPWSCKLGNGPIEYYCNKYGVKIFKTLEDVVNETIHRIS